MAEPKNRPFCIREGRSLARIRTRASHAISEVEASRSSWKSMVMCHFLKEGSPPRKSLSLSGPGLETIFGGSGAVADNTAESDDSSCGGDVSEFSGIVSS